MANNVIEILENLPKDLSKLGIPSKNILIKANEFLIRANKGSEAVKESGINLSELDNVRSYKWALGAFNRTDERRNPNEVLPDLSEAIKKILNNQNPEQEEIGETKEFFSYLEDIAIARSAHPIDRFIIESI